MLTADNIVVATLDRDVVALVLNLEVPKRLLPGRMFAPIFADWRLPGILTAGHDHVGILFTDTIKIVLKPSLQQIDA